MEKKPKKIGEILIEKGLLSKKDLDTALEIQKDEKKLIEKKTLTLHRKHLIFVVAFSLLLSAFPITYFHDEHFFKNIDQKIYSELLKLEYLLRKAPLATKDIVIVGIDNETVLKMPQRWPYPRQDFATVIENIKKAQPRVLGIDFAYFGKSTKEDDTLLQQALDSNLVVLAATINEYGYLSIFNDSANLKNQASYGIATKFQDEDGIIRKSLVYLVTKDKKQEGFLSWGMQILKITKGIDADSLQDNIHTVSFKNQAGEHWNIPVDPISKSFLIHFRAHTRDFQEIPFYRVLKGDFDPNLIKNKIVLLGVLPALFQDIQNTPLGWLPGVILNANTFLALYTHNFLQEVPKLTQIIIIIIGVILTTIFLLLLSTPKALTLIILEICLFFISSYLLLISGYVWDYITFPVTIVICPILAKKLIRRNFLDLIVKV